MDKMHVLGIHYIGDTAHDVLFNWMKSVNSQIHPFFPSRLNFLKGRRWLNQPLGFLRGYFFPVTEVYLHTGMASLITTAFKPGKNIVMNVDCRFRFLDNDPWLTKKYIEFLLSRIDGMIAPDNTMKKLAEKYTDVPIEIVPLYCDVERFIHIKPDLDSENICYIGDSYFPKEVDILLKSFYLIKRDYPKTKLIICGDGPLRKKYEDRPDIIWYKYHPQVEKILKHVGTYINASRHDSSGVNVMESMCAGIPVILSEFYTGSDMLPKSAKHLITRLDPWEIAKKYKELKENKNKEKIGKDCQRVAKNFTKERSLKMFKRAFNKLTR